MNISFELLSEDNNARLGLIKTPRGNIHTPAFMPVGTLATVKALTIDQVLQTKSEIILCNTYHLLLRPCVERISRVGGLHKFMNCKLPILTDSEDFKLCHYQKVEKFAKKV